MKKNMLWSWIRAEKWSLASIFIILPMLMIAWSMDFVATFRDDVPPWILIIGLVGSLVLLSGFTVGVLSQAYWYWRVAQE